MQWAEPLAECTFDTSSPRDQGCKFLAVQGPDNHIVPVLCCFRQNGKMVVIAVPWSVLGTGQCGTCTLKTLHTFNHPNNPFSVANSLMRRVHTCLGSGDLQSSCLDELGLGQGLDFLASRVSDFFFLVNHTGHVHKEKVI